MDDDLRAGSLVRRWQLGRQLRDYRAAAGVKPEQAAKFLGVTRQTINRIENGRQAILPKNVRFLCQLYEVGAPTVDMLMRQAEETSLPGWWAAYSDTVPGWFEMYVGFESECAALSEYSSELVPGLLQVPEYVRAIAGVASEADIDNAVRFRLARQQRLAANPPEHRVVLNEAVLRRPVGAMGDQLRHLIEVAEQDWCTLQVIPWDVGPHPSMGGPFTLMTLPDEPGPNFVYLEHLTGALYLERPVDLATYGTAFDDLTERALSPEKSRDLLVTLCSEHLGN